MPARAVPDKVSGYFAELNTSADENVAACKQQYRDFRQLQRKIARVTDDALREELFDMVEDAAMQTDEMVDRNLTELELGTYVRANKFEAADAIVMGNNAKRRKAEAAKKGQATR